MRRKVLLTLGLLILAALLPVLAEPVPPAAVPTPAQARTAEARHKKRVGSSVDKKARGAVDSSLRDPWPAGLPERELGGFLFGRERTLTSEE